MPDSPTDLQTRLGEAITSGDLAALDEIISPDVVDHDPAPGQAPGPAGYKDFFTTMRASFPDMHVEVEHLVASGDDVAFAYTLTGTHTGEPFQGIAPSGNGIEVRGMQISRFADGKMVERWGATDEATMHKQLTEGAKPDL